MAGIDTNMLLLLAGALALVWWMKRRSQDTTGEQARQLVKDGALLLDVRSPGEFAGGHLPGAKNVPVQELGGRLRELGQQSRPVVVYCLSGGRSAQAAQMLKAAGFTAVHNLGPMGRW